MKHWKETVKSQYISICFLLLIGSCITAGRDNFPVDYFREADRNVMRLYFTGQKNYSFSVSGDSPLLEHKCPVAVSTSEYIYVDSEFTDTAFDREEIALYNIFI